MYLKYWFLIFCLILLPFWITPEIIYVTSEKQVRIKDCEHRNPLKLLEYRSSFNEVLKNLIENWQSPIVYLKNRGYVPEEITSETSSEFRTDTNGKRKRLSKNNTPLLREKRKMKLNRDDLSKILLATNKFEIPGASKGFQNKLGTSFDTERWRTLEKKEATTFYEEMLNKLIRKGFEGDDMATDIIYKGKEDIPLQIPNFVKNPAKDKIYKSNCADNFKGVKGFAKKGKA